MVSAIRERLSSEYPSRCITPNVATSESGSATAGISVARGERRNRKITPTTSPIASISVNCTSRTLARIVSVRSATTTMRNCAGSVRRSWGRAALTRSTVSTILAPGWRWISTTTAGIAGVGVPSGRVPKYHAPARTFSSPPTTVPRSESRTGAPPRHETTRSR